MMDHFIMMDRSRDLSTIEKTFAQGRIMHLQSIFHYGDFINAAIREWSFPYPKEMGISLRRNGHFLEVRFYPQGNAHSSAGK